MAKTQTSPKRIAVYLGIGLVCFGVIVSKPYWSKLLEPNRVKEETIVQQAPPEKVDVPEVVQEAALNILKAEPKMRRLAALKQETALKGAILDVASTYGIAVDFSDSSGSMLGGEVPNAVQYESNLTETLPALSFGYRKEDSAKLDIAEEAVAPITPTPTIEVPSIIEDVEIYMAFKKAQKVSVVFRVPNIGLWDTDTTLAFKGMKVKSVGPNEICISEGKMARCFTI